MLEQLIVIRHGEYGGDMLLSGTGKSQMYRLADALEPLLSGRKTTLLTSTAPRAHGSAEVLCSVLGLGYEEHPLLWSDDRHREDIAAAIDLIEQQEAAGYRVVILVTHLEYVEDLPPAFLRERFSGAPRPPAPRKGQALVINMAGSEVTTNILPDKAA